MTNVVVLIGNISNDLTLKYSPSGVPICKFSIAVKRTFKTNDNIDVDFINCTVFNKQAESLVNYMKKGSKISVEGRIQTGSYQKDDGTKVFTTDVIANNIQFLEKKKDDFINQPGPIQVQEDYTDKLPF